MHHAVQSCFTAPQHAKVQHYQKMNVFLTNTCICPFCSRRRYERARADNFGKVEDRRSPGIQKLVQCACQQRGVAPGRAREHSLRILSASAISGCDDCAQRLQIISTLCESSGVRLAASSWGQPWSPHAPGLRHRSASLPRRSWSFQVGCKGDGALSSTSLDKVSFPIGRKFISERMPGKVRMASILPLPNIGNVPTDFYAAAPPQMWTPGANSKAVLEAFWPQSRVLSSASPRDGVTRIRYSSPTKSMPSVNQTVLVQLCSSEGGARR